MLRRKLLDSRALKNSCSMTKSFDNKLGVMSHKNETSMEEKIQLSQVFIYGQQSLT